MKKSYSKSSRQGLPGGPNEMFQKVKGIIVSERGQWDFPGMNTLVPTQDGRITMRGVPYPVLGQDETGYTQMMYPEQEYQFPGKNVLELPMAQKGLQKTKLQPWEYLDEEGNLHTNTDKLPFDPMGRQKYAEELNWMGNWISKRRPQMQSAIQSYYDKKDEKYPIDAFLKKYITNPLFGKPYSYDLTNDWNITDEQLGKTILHNAQNNLKKLRFKDSSKINPDSYLPRAWGTYTPYGHHIYFYGEDPSDETKIHEIGHGTRLGSQKIFTSLIEDIIKNDELYKTKYDSYYHSPEEVYSRIWELRKGLDLRPTDKITKKNLKEKIQKINSDDALDIFRHLKVDTIIKLLNDLVYQEPASELPMAQKGCTSGSCGTPPDPCSGWEPGNVASTKGISYKGMPKSAAQALASSSGCSNIMTWWAQANTPATTSTVFPSSSGVTTPPKKLIKKILVTKTPVVEETEQVEKIEEPTITQQLIGPGKPRHTYQFPFRNTVSGDTETRVSLVTPEHEYIMTKDQFDELGPTDSIPGIGNFLYRMNRKPVYNLKKYGGALPKFQNTGEKLPEQQVEEPKPFVLPKGKGYFFSETGETNLPKKLDRIEKRRLSRNDFQTEEDYVNFLTNKKSKFKDFDCTEDGCAEFANNRAGELVGLGGADYAAWIRGAKYTIGAGGHAWQTYGNLLSLGGKSIFNNYRKQGDISQAKPGDIVGLRGNWSVYSRPRYDTSGENAPKAGVDNSHQGVVEYVDSKGNVYVRHNVNGTARVEKIEPTEKGYELDKSGWDIVTVARPNFERYKYAPIKYRDEIKQYYVDPYISDYNPNKAVVFKGDYVIGANPMRVKSDFGNFMLGEQRQKTDWLTGKSNTEVFPVTEKSGNEDMQKFIDSLNDNKEALMDYYRLSDDEFNEIAKYAVATAGAESDFGTSSKLAFKTKVPDIARGAKIIRDLKNYSSEEMSSGIGQVKPYSLDEVFKQTFGLHRGNIVLPEKNALAVFSHLVDDTRKAKLWAERNKDLPEEVRTNYPFLGTAVYVNPYSVRSGNLTYDESFQNNPNKPFEPIGLDNHRLRIISDYLKDVDILDLSKLYKGQPLEEIKITPQQKYGGSLPKAQPGLQTQNPNEVKYGTPEYEQAYNQGTLVTRLSGDAEDAPLRTRMLPEVTFEAFKESGQNVLENYPYFNTLTEEEKKYFRDTSPIGRNVRRIASRGREGFTDEVNQFATGLLYKTPLSVFQIPQSAIVEGVQGLRGKDASLKRVFDPNLQRVPSDVWGFENKPGFGWEDVGNFGMDMSADPLNLVGAGLLKSPIKAALRETLDPTGLFRMTGRGLKQAAKRIKKPIRNLSSEELKNLEKLRRVFHNSERFLSRSEVELLGKYGFGKRSKYRNADLINNNENYNQFTEANNSRVTNWLDENTLNSSNFQINNLNQRLAQDTPEELRRAAKQMLQYRNPDFSNVTNLQSAEEALINWSNQNRLEVPYFERGSFQHIFDRYNIPTDVRDVDDAARLLERFSSSQKSQFLKDIISEVPRLMTTEDLYRARINYNNSFNNTASRSTPSSKPVVKNKSGLTKEEALLRAEAKDKDVISKMSEEEFENTVLKPNGEIVPYYQGSLEPQFSGSQNVVPLSHKEYTDEFNSKLDLLNDIIAQKNKSGVEYRVKGLDENGRLVFYTPEQTIKQGDVNVTIPSGQSSWGVRLNPGQWRGNVEDIANTMYFRGIPGLEMSNTTQGVFADNIPRRGTGAYEAINEYLKRLDLGRVKPGFNSQTSFSRGAWENFIKSGRAVGFYNDPRTIYGTMKTIAPIMGVGAAGTYGANQLINQEPESYQNGGSKLNPYGMLQTYPGEAGTGVFGDVGLSYDLPVGVSPYVNNRFAVEPGYESFINPGFGIEKPIGNRGSAYMGANIFDNRPMINAGFTYRFDDGGPLQIDPVLNFITQQQPRRFSKSKK